MFQKNSNELAYPFLYDAPESLMCDHEILSDELCSLCGLILSLLPADTTLKGELEHRMRKIYDLNGSLRGHCAIDEDDLAELSKKCDEYSVYSVNAGSVFVLPAGCPAACAAHVARVRAKALVRLLYREHERGGAVDDKLIRYANLLSNYFFLLALKINALCGVKEIPFVSNSYGAS